MFQFPGLAPGITGYQIALVGCPIRISTDQFVFANPRGFSQLITSFFASESLGIPRTPLITFFSCSYFLFKVLSFLCSLFSQYVKELLSQAVNRQSSIFSTPDPFHNRSYASTRGIEPHLYPHPGVPYSL